MGTTIGSMFRSLCGTVDSIIYILISKLYDLFIDVTNLVLYSENAMNAIGKRIGLILGIVMLFRVAISLITYLISPDKIKDQAKGGSKMITNAIFSFILLVTINPIFSQAYKFQIKLVESSFIEKIFFGPKADVPNVDLAYSLYTSFITPKIEECSEMFDPFVGITDACANRLNSITNRNTINVITERTIGEHKFNYLLMSYDTLNYRINGEYIFDYFMIVSTIAGALVALILISFCMDIATRAVKLLFLQIIAPIPIIANIDPDKGSEVFKKWGKECINTYVSLFIKLIAINFAVFMITLIRSEFHDLFAGKGPLLTVFIIIGCLMFAKQVPKLIENITGIKSEGFTLNPIKKFQDQALFGKQIVGAGKGLTKAAVAGSIGAATGGIGAGIASGKLGNSTGENVWSFFRGAGRGFVGSARAGIKSKNGIEAVKAGNSRWGKEADYVNSLDGTDFKGRTRAWTQQRLHVATDADLIKKDIENLNNFEKTNDAALKRAEAESIKYNRLVIQTKDIDGSTRTVTMAQHKQDKERLTRLRNEIVDREHFMKTNEKSANIKKEWQANNLFRYTLSDGEVDWEQANEAYRNYLSSNPSVKAGIDAEFEKYAKEHDEQIQKLNDQINIDAKKFALEYIDRVNNNNLINNAGEQVDDIEIKNYVNQSEHYEKELAKRNIKVTTKVETDAAGNTVEKSLNMKDAKQNAVEIRQQIESNFNAKDKNGNEYNKYQRAQANAAATKPGKGN